jgi:hypothetical protein
MTLRASKAGLISSKSSTSPKIRKRRQIIITKSSQFLWTDPTPIEISSCQRKSKKPKKD